MKKRMQFEEATMELILFGFDVVTASGTDPYGNYFEPERTQEFDHSLANDAVDTW